MKSLLLIGGARSGKSSIAARAAQQLAERHGGSVSMLVAGVATDDEMAARIARHQQDRPPSFRTVEAPYDLDSRAAAAPPETVVLIDCVTVWLSNLLVQGDDPADIEARGSALAEIVAQRRAPTVVVTNEVGTGVVPAEPMGRAFRDVQGRVNQALADRADRAMMVVAGRLLPLQSADDLWTI